MPIPMSVAKLRAPLALAAAVCLAAAGGCASSGDEGFPETVPVKGKVTMAGQPLPKGSISFIPNSGRPATALIQPDGTYVLSTFEEKDGAVPGHFRVTVTATTADPNQMPRPGEPPPKALVPKKYNRPESSGLTADVDKKDNKDFDFDLK
jgi:hypothetical protein